MAACAADNKTACPVFPKENIGANKGGGNKSPELDWTAGPSGTQSYAIVLQDLTNLDATTKKPFVHWVMWNIPAATRMLPAGLETTQMPSVPAGASQRNYNTTGTNFGYQGSGKCENVYEFVLYALPTATYTGTSTTQTAVRDGLVTSGAPTATLRARSGAPGCTG
jgi:Raf kinase inhibitor-like YbhB/YbcL family protein